MTCKYCDAETGMTGGAHSNHVRWCDKNPSRSEYARKLSIARSAIKNPGNQYTKAAREGRTILISEETKKKISWAGRRHSQETKQKLSEIRKAWLAEHPDEHPWKLNSKFKSVPCEVLKERLREAGLVFKEEYTLLDDRSFAVDIAFPEKKVAVEVNGEQHYNRDGTLRPYYRDRHDIIEASGWKILEIHYARCYHRDVIQEIFDVVK
jgi:very-short-patch-repair endonuclease